MIKIRILKDEVSVIKGVSQKGKPYEMHLQTGYAYVVDESGQIAEIPEKFEFVLPSGPDGSIVAPFKRGDYTLSPASVFVRDGRLSISPRVLPAPVQAGVQK